MPETEIVHRNGGIAANGDWDNHNQTGAHAALLNTTGLVELFRWGQPPFAGNVEANAKAEKAGHGKNPRRIRNLDVFYTSFCVLRATFRGLPFCCIWMLLAGVFPCGFVNGIFNLQSHQILLPMWPAIDDLAHKLDRPPFNIDNGGIWQLFFQYKA